VSGSVPFNLLFASDLLFKLLITSAATIFLETYKELSAAILKSDSGIVPCNLFEDKLLT
jgi:hypothetical protein